MGLFKRNLTLSWQNILTLVFLSLLLVQGLSGITGYKVGFAWQLLLYAISGIVIIKLTVGANPSTFMKSKGYWTVVLIIVAGCMAVGYFLPQVMPTMFSILPLRAVNGMQPFAVVRG